MNIQKRLPVIVLLLLLVLLVVGLVGAGQGVEELGRPPLMPVDAGSVQPVPQQTAGLAGQGLEGQGLDPQAYLPLTIRNQASSSPWLDTQSRGVVQNFYLTEYLASEGVPSGWNGNHSSCNAGNTSAAFKTAMLTRINYFRAMAGIPLVTAFKNEYNTKAQKAALMMSVNNMLDHSPPSNWTCYTADGAEAAGSSNLYLGVYGPSAITGYIQDEGAGNYPVGHRRWILYPQSQFMGTGDIPPSGTGNPPSNALWVFDLEHIGDPRPPTREEYTAWPPPGYTPYQVVFQRWSFGKAFADIENANVTMTKNGQPLSLQVNPIEYGYGERTLVWEPNDNFGQAPTSDTTYTVTISNVIIDGVSRTFNYQVIIFKP